MRGDSETGRCSKAVGQTVLSGPSIRSLLVSDKGRPPVMNQRSLTEAEAREMADHLVIVVGCIESWSLVAAALMERPYRASLGVESNQESDTSDRDL